MSPVTDQLPVAVYGTLRPGCGNDRLWQGRATVTLEGALVPGFRLVTNGGFPYAIPVHGRVSQNEAADIITTVSIIQPDADEYAAVMARLDALEGVPTHYTRRIVDVLDPETGEWSVAWMYVPTDPAHVAHLAPVPGNDWRNAERGW